MISTGLTEKEKESLIKYICTLGRLVITMDNRRCIEFTEPIYVDNTFTPGHLLEKAFMNISNQSRGIK